MDKKVKKIKQHNVKQIDYFSSVDNPIGGSSTAPYKIRQMNEMIKFANIEPGDAILEVGCGSGDYTLNLAERGFNVEGLDLTPYLLDKLKKENNNRFKIPLYCSDIVDHPPELNNRYDAVIGFHVFHHVHDITACFKAMSDMVKPGGTVAIIEPNAFCPFFYIQVIITPSMGWKGERGITKMRKRIIFDAMQKAGLIELEITRFGFTPPFISNQQWGYKLDTILEKIPCLRPILPFQLTKGTKINLNK